MKTISGPLASHLNLDTTTLATCWKVTRTDGTVYAFTDHDQDLTVSAVTYISSNSYTRSALKNDQSLAVDNLEVIGMFNDSSIKDSDMANGFFDYADVEMFIVNWRDLTMGILKLRKGWLGECVMTPTGVFKAELRGLTQALTTQWGDLFSPTCRADLFDTQCALSATAYTGTGTVTSVSSFKLFTSTEMTFVPFSQTNSASVVITSAMAAANSGLGIVITINGTPHGFTIPFFDNYADAITSLVSQINTAAIGVTAGGFFSTDNLNAVNLLLNNVLDTGLVTKVNDINNYLTVHSFADGYFNKGTITWLTGNNTGVTEEIYSYDHSQSLVSLFLNMKKTIQVGDTFTYRPGCDKRRETCYFKFNNIANLRAEPDMPGMDAVLTYPDAFQTGGLLA